MLAVFKKVIMVSLMMSRRRFLQGLAGVTAVTAATGFYTFRIEPSWVQDVHLSMPIRHLPPDLEGKILVQISDMHIGDRYDYSYQIDHFKRIQQLAPDFVVYTGDFVTYDNVEQFDQLRQVLAHAPLGKLGTAAILGNHDYGRGWNQQPVATQIAALLANADIPVLRNEIRSFSGLNIGGIDEFWGTNYVPERVTAVIPSNEPSIILCHNPDVADEPIWHNYQGWILAGHTHGGQVKPPFLPPPLLPVNNKRYTSGVFDVGNGRFLYINRGLGNLWSVRFNARPEISIFTLANKS